VSSGEEPKPKRGSREQLTLFLGGLECKDPVALAFVGKGHEGCAEPVVALASSG